MSDTRNWLQKFFDQMYGARQFTINMSPEQANKALNIFGGYKKKDWRTKEIIGELENALSAMSIVNGQEVVTVVLDTSNTIRMRDIGIGLTKDNMGKIIEDNGFVRTETSYPK